MLLVADEDDLRIWRQKSASLLAGALSVNANTNRCNFRASCQAMKSSIRSIGCMRRRPASAVPFEQPRTQGTQTRVGNREPRTDNPEPRTENREPRTENRERERRTPNAERRPPTPEPL